MRIYLFFWRCFGVESGFWVDEEAGCEGACGDGRDGPLVCVS